MKFRKKFGKVPVRTEKYLNYYESGFPFKEFEVTGFPETIQQSFKKYSEAEQYAYVFDYPERCTIEPNAGWCINGDMELLEASIAYAPERNIPVPNFLKYRITPKNRRHIPELISLRFGLENYWHFFNDGIGALYMLYENGYDYNMPVLLPDKIRKKRYFNEFLEISSLSNKVNWVFQKSDEYFVVDRVVLPKNIPNISWHFEKICQDLPMPESKIENNRIFLIRGEKSSRRLSNQSEMQSFMKGEGFQVVDADHLSLKEQIRIFRNTRYLVAIHGAGLTNIIYRQGNPMTLVELLPGNMISPHYFWLSKELDYHYVPVIGSRFDDEKNFYVDMEPIKQAISSILK